MLGLIVIDHGSRRAEANAQLLDVVARLALLAPGTVIEPAHMELAEPSLDQAFARAVARGAREIRVLPYFLGDGRHAQEDIPRLARAAAAAHAGVVVSVAAPLGPHDLLARLLAIRAGLPVAEDDRTGPPVTPGR